MFRFKKFTIEQERCAMKVGTDGCLLGAWANIGNCNYILDIGCGSGLISIMSAQRSTAHIIGVEIDSEAAAQARENAERSPWGNRIEIVNTDILKYRNDKLFDAIISNPPFFADSLKCPDSARSIARHNTTLPCNAFMQSVKELLREGGTLSIIIPANLCESWCDEALYKGLCLRRITYVRTLPHKQPKRVLMEFVKGAHSQPAIGEFTIESSPGVYSNEAIELLRDFYIKLADN